MLASLTREGTLIAAFESAHESFHRYHEATVRFAASAASDARALEQLREIFNAYLDQFHAHHTAEEVHLFPTLRRVAPELAPAVDQLLVQHGRLAKQLSVVSQDIGRLEWATAGDAIPALVQDLGMLHDIGVEHLEFEESVTVPVISTWTEWPFCESDG